MNSRLLAPLVLLMLALPAKASDPWTTFDTSLEIASEVGIASEWGQTRWAVNNPCPYYIGGIDQKILGSHPKMHNVNLYFASILLVHPIVSYKLSKPYRELFQGATITFEAIVLPKNASIGCRVSF